MKIWLPTVRAGSGSDVFVERLASGLRDAGHDAVVQWFPRKYEFFPWLLSAQPAPPGTDVVHANSWQGFAFKRPGIPLVVTEHHYVCHPDFMPLRTSLQAAYHWLFIQRFVARSYRAADALVAVSRNTADAMQRDFSGEVNVIPNGVDTELFRPDASRRPQGQACKLSLLFVGNPAPRKGADLLPALATRLGNSYDILCLGGLRDAAPNIALPNVSVLRTVPPGEMPTLYRSADAILVLARYEAFGYVALEAMACGKPVVGFDSTGTSEICVNEETALLSPVDDLGALASNIARLRDDAALCMRLGMAGRSRAVSGFSMNRFVDAYIVLYERTAATFPKCAAQAI